MKFFYYNVIGSMGNNENYKSTAIKMLHKGDFKSAEIYFKKYYRRTKNKPELYNSLGNVFRAAGNQQKAIRYYKKAIKLEPRFGLAWSNLSFSLAGEKNYLEAIRTAEQALELLSNSKSFSGLRQQLKKEVSSYKKRRMRMDFGKEKRAVLSDAQH
ncbi:MAG: tetratricopeptide repeat protein [Candidatus Harrisonbacteria bacterium]|nr:tetratricopeptide repeat protein [Candidatus Harrisonbacteria bacterium]